jgi:hypothetical protein
MQHFMRWEQFYLFWLCVAYITKTTKSQKCERLRELRMYCSSENIYWQQTKISAVNSFLSEILQKSTNC